MFYRPRLLIFVCSNRYVISTLNIIVLLLQKYDFGYFTGDVHVLPTWI